MAVYTVEEIALRVAPVAREYQLPAVYLFGSYARGEATEESDIDLLVDVAGTRIRGLFSTTSPYSLGGLYCDLEEALDKEVDLVTLDALRHAADGSREGRFRKAVLKERVKVYGSA